MIAKFKNSLDSLFSDFVREHERALFRYLRTLIQDFHAAEDLKQETFLRAFRAYRQGRVPPNPRAWLLQIAKNLVIDQSRKRRARALGIEDLGDSLIAAERAFDEGPQLKLDGNERPYRSFSAPLREEFHKLPEPYRRLIHSRYRAGKTSWETATLSGLSTDRAKVKLHRGRRRLKSLLLSRMRNPQCMS